MRTTGSFGGAMTGLVSYGCGSCGSYQDLASAISQEIFFGNGFSRWQRLKAVNPTTRMARLKACPDTDPKHGAYTNLERALLRIEKKPDNRRSLSKTGRTLFRMTHLRPVMLK